MKTFDTYLGLSEEELKFLHCFIGGCDDYLIKHAMSINEDYTSEEKERLEKLCMNLYEKIDREIKSIENA